MVHLSASISCTEDWQQVIQASRSLADSDSFRYESGAALDRWCVWARVRGCGKWNAQISSSSRLIGGLISLIHQRRYRSDASFQSDAGPETAWRWSDSGVVLVIQATTTRQTSRSSRSSAPFIPAPLSLIPANWTDSGVHRWQQLWCLMEYDDTIWQRAWD